jgi:hypothetical protein
MSTQGAVCGRSRTWHGWAGADGAARIGPAGFAGQIGRIKGVGVLVTVLYVIFSGKWCDLFSAIWRDR